MSTRKVVFTETDIVEACILLLAKRERLCGGDFKIVLYPGDVPIRARLEWEEGDVERGNMFNGCTPEIDDVTNEVVAGKKAAN